VTGDAAAGATSPSAARSGATDDLQRILGYVDATADTADGAEDVTEVAPDIVLVPCWTRSFCQAVVRAADLVGFTPHPDDPVPGHEVSLAAISPRLYATVEEDLGRRIWPSLRTVWPLVEYHGLRDAFVIRYSAGEQEHLRRHHDIAQISATIRLNDDYDGAELRFPRQRYDNAGQPVGSLLAWPSLVTHPHETMPLRRGVKYGLTIWFELPAAVLAL
jgi:hypothetical protein